jgi:hypothetical protein
MDGGDEGDFFTPILTLPRRGGGDFDEDWRGIKYELAIYFG